MTHYETTVWLWRQGLPRTVLYNSETAWSFFNAPTFILLSSSSLTGLLIHHHNPVLESQSLQPLLADLPSYLIHVRSDNTIKAYTVGFNKWKKWCSSNSVSHLPADPLTFALFHKIFSPTVMSAGSNGFSSRQRNVGSGEAVE